MSRLSFDCTRAYPGGFQLDVAFETTEPVTALFGPSGSGKTSVLEMLAGVRTPAHGRIALGDTTVLDTSQAIAQPPERRHVGVVFQDQLLFPHMSVDKNLRYGAQRASGNGVDFDRVVDVLEIGALLERKPQNLSGGERQRVAIGRALLSRPSYLLLDEPLVALDEPLRHRILSYIQRVVEEWGIPTLFVSHGQAEVRRFADWVVVLDAGRVVAEGPPENALTESAPMAFTGGAGPMNLLRVEAVAEQNGKVVGSIGNQSLQLPPSDKSLADTVFVEFAPDTVLLSRGDVADISARNHLRGTVRRVLELEVGCFVGIDVGQIVWAEVTPSAVQELKLQVGADVTCLIKTHSLRVVA